MKKVKLLLSVLACLFLCSITMAQTSYFEANEYYEEEKFYKAIPLYQKAFEKKPSSECAAKLGYCYFNLRNIEEAKVWFEKATKFNNYDPTINLVLGEVHKQLQQYDRAIVYFDLYAKSAPLYAEMAKKYARGCDSLNRGIQSRESLTVQTIDQINTSFDEFSPAQYQQSIVFSSDRYDASERLNKKINPQTGTAFLSMYIAEAGQNGNSDAKPLWEKSVFGHHEGTKSFTKNNEIYYTSVLEERNEVGVLQIFKARVENEALVDKEPFEHNVPDASDAHPFVSADGLRLYFVSDRGNGYGGTDIYVCDKEVDGWSAPRNLGPGINTEYDEVFPFEQAENCLYFSSNRPSSQGGLDFYRSVKSNGLWQQSLNMGAPLNSSRDDFGIVFIENDAYGYFSSNRTGGKGGDDLYMFQTTSAFQAELQQQFKGGAYAQNNSGRGRSNDMSSTNRTAQTDQKSIVGTLEVKDLALQENPDGDGYIIMGMVEEKYETGEVQAAENAALKIYDKETGQSIDSYTDQEGSFQFKSKSKKAPGAYDKDGRPLFIPEDEQKTQPNGNPREALAYDENDRPLYYYDRNDMAMLNEVEKSAQPNFGDGAEPVQQAFDENGETLNPDMLDMSNQPTGDPNEKVAYSKVGTPLYFYTPKTNEEPDVYDEYGGRITVPMSDRFNQPTGLEDEKVAYDENGNPLFFYVPADKRKTLAFDEKGNQLMVPESEQRKKPLGVSNEKVGYDADGRPLFFYTSNEQTAPQAFDEGGQPVDVPIAEQRKRPNGTPGETVAYDQDGRPLFFYNIPPNSNASINNPAYNDPSRSDLGNQNNLPPANSGRQVGSNKQPQNGAGGATTNPSAQQPILSQGIDGMVYGENGEALFVPVANQRRQPSSAMQEKIAYDQNGQPLFYYFSQDAQNLPQNSIDNFQNQINPQAVQDPKQYSIQTSKPGFFTKNMNILADPSRKQIKVLSENELLININYDYNDAKILPESEVILNQLVDYLERNPQLDIVLRSYCDVRGSEAYNLQLSKRRAESVKTYLILKGIHHLRIQSFGLGESDPILPFAKSDAEHYVNRRTEFTLSPR